MHRRQVRLFLVDEHAIVRQGLKALLSSTPEFNIVGESGDGVSAIKAISFHQPDILITDLHLPRMSGKNLIAELRTRRLKCQPLVLTSDRTDNAVYQAFRAGATGYVLKSCNHQELVLAIRNLSIGHTYLTPAVSSSLVQKFISDPAFPTASHRHPLTRREDQVLQLVAEGLTNRQCASHLNISIKTVEKHRHNLMHKLKLRNIRDLLEYWRTSQDNRNTDPPDQLLDRDNDFPETDNDITVAPSLAGRTAF